MQEKIKKAIKLTTDSYLEKHLFRVPEDKKEIAINAYNSDIERISDYVFNSGFLNDDFLLSEDFIKGLHKKFYPENFFQKGIDKNGNEVIWMIPGEYKKIDNFSNTSEKIKFFSDLPGWTEEKAQYIKKELVGKEMKELVEKFNIDYNKANNLQDKKDLIFLFTFDFLIIHPFSDGNGRIAGIVLDLYLEKLGFGAIGLKDIVGKDKLISDRIIFLSKDQRNPKYMYDFIEQNK